MQNENLENKAGQVRRNPSRDNKNINQGQYNEKRVDNEADKNRDAETDKKKFSGNESSVDGGRVSDTSSDNTDNGRAGKTQQNAAGKNAGDKQTGSQDFQSTPQKRKADDASYDVNEQFDLDEDFGNSTRQ